MKRKALLLICCLAAHGLVTPISFAAGPETSSDTPQIVTEARDLIDSDDLMAAKTLLQQANSANPNDPDILNMLGFVCRKVDQLGDAATYYAQALAIDPDHKGALEYQGELYLLLKRPEKAKANLERLGELCAENCEEYEDLAEALAAYEADTG